MTYHLMHWGFRFIIAYAVALAMMTYLGRQHKQLLSILIGALSVGVITLSQLLWSITAGLTFKIVQLMLSPFISLYSDPVERIIGTDKFLVQIAPICSGLEGIGLILVFCTGWLWWFRRDYKFPRVLVLFPIGVVVMFLLNAARISTFLWIGNAGYSKAAILGFHSMAGWVAFNLTALGIAVCTQRISWFAVDKT